MKIIESLRALVGFVRNIADEYRELQKHLTEVRTRRAWLDSAPRPRACVTAALDQLIATCYQTDFDKVARTIVSEIQQRPCNKLSEFYPSHDFLGRLTSGRALTYLVAATLRTELQRAVAAMDWPTECGPPHAARETEKAALDQQIRELESQLAEIRDAADQAGIALGS